MFEKVLSDFLQETILQLENVNYEAHIPIGPGFTAVAAAIPMFIQYQLKTKTTSIYTSELLFLACTHVFFLHSVIIVEFRRLSLNSDLCLMQTRVHRYVTTLKS